MSGGVFSCGSWWAPVLKALSSPGPVTLTAHLVSHASHLPFRLYFCIQQWKYLSLRPNRAMHWWNHCLFNPRLTNPLTVSVRAGCAPHHNSTEQARTSAGPKTTVKSEAAVLWAWECSAQQGFRPLDRELVGLKTLAFIPCSQLLPQMSRLYYRDEFGWLQEQLEVGSKSQELAPVQDMAILKKEVRGKKKAVFRGYGH